MSNTILLFSSKSTYHVYECRKLGLQWTLPCGQFNNQDCINVISSQNDTVGRILPGKSKKPETAVQDNDDDKNDSDILYACKMMTMKKRKKIIWLSAVKSLPYISKTVGHNCFSQNFLQILCSTILALSKTSGPRYSRKLSFVTFDLELLTTLTRGYMRLLRQL